MGVGGGMYILCIYVNTHLSLNLVLITMPVMIVAIASTIIINIIVTA